MNGRVVPAHPVTRISLVQERPTSLQAPPHLPTYTPAPHTPVAKHSFKSHPLVAQPPHLRFYAGVPLVTSDGCRLGTLCVLDYRPRAFSAECVSVLANLVCSRVQRVRVCVRMCVLCSGWGWYFCATHRQGVGYF